MSSGYDEQGNVICEACAEQELEATEELEREELEQLEREQSCRAWNQRRVEELRRKVEATRATDDAVIVQARREAAVLHQLGVKRIAATGNIRQALEITAARREA